MPNPPSAPPSFSFSLDGSNLCFVEDHVMLQYAIPHGVNELLHRHPEWAQSVAEREPGVASVSAPVRDARGVVIAAVSVSGPIDRIGRRPGARWAADLVAAAEALTRRL